MTSPELTHKEGEVNALKTVVELTFTAVSQTAEFFDPVGWSLNYPALGYTSKQLITNKATVLGHQTLNVW